MKAWPQLHILKAIAGIEGNEKSVRKPQIGMLVAGEESPVDQIAHWRWNYSEGMWGTSHGILWSQLWLGAEWCIYQSSIGWWALTRHNDGHVTEVYRCMCNFNCNWAVKWMTHQVASGWVPLVAQSFWSPVYCMWYQVSEPHGSLAGALPGFSFGGRRLVEY